MIAQRVRDRIEQAIARDPALTPESLAARLSRPVQDVWAVWEGMDAAQHEPSPKPARQKRARADLDAEAAARAAAVADLARQNIPDHEIAEQVGVCTDTAARLRRQAGITATWLVRWECGTSGGVRAHYRRGQPPCRACRDAENRRRAERNRPCPRCAGRFADVPRHLRRVHGEDTA